MREARSRPWVTYALIAANTVAFVLEILGGADPARPTAQQILALGGNFGPMTLGGEPWRLVTSMFLHFGIIHIALNMLCLYRARFVEQLFGHLELLVIYLLAGLGGGVATLVFGAGGGVAAGASGAVFGVFGAFGAFLLLRRDAIVPEAQRRLTMSLGRFLVLNLAVGLAVKSIALAAHIGGLVVGFGVAAALLAGAKADVHRMRRALLIAAAGIAAVALTLVAIPPRHDAPTAMHDFHRVNAASTAAFIAMEQRRKAHEITDEQSADIIDREILPPLRAVGGALAAVGDVPATNRALFDRARDLVTARIDHLEALAVAWRERDPARRNDLFEQVRALTAPVTTAREALDAEIARRAH